MLQRDPAALREHIYHHLLLLKYHSAPLKELSVCVQWFISRLKYVTDVVDCGLIRNLRHLHLSMSFDMKGRLEMWWKFLKISGSRRICSISVVNIASLRFPDIVLDVRDRSIILVTMGKSTPMHCLRTHVGMGSKSHDLVAEWLIRLCKFIYMLSYIIYISTTVIMRSHIRGGGCIYLFNPTFSI